MKKKLNFAKLLFSLIFLSLLSCEKEEFLPTQPQSEQTITLKPQKKISDESKN